jgi:aminoglycoside 6'-N-acetyltransferase I
MVIRPVHESDAEEWARLREKLWPAAPGEHASEISAFFHGNKRIAAQVFVALDESARTIAFAEVSIRSQAEGCESDRVAYLEGWFVDETHRGKGVGAALVRAVEAWGSAEGCTELASDTEIENHAGAAAHRALGFEEAGRVICFRKALSKTAPR